MDQHAGTKVMNFRLYPPRKQILTANDLIAAFFILKSLTNQQFTVRKTKIEAAVSKKPYVKMGFSLFLTTFLEKKQC